MKTAKNIAPRYLEKAAIEEFAGKLRDQGYLVEVEKKFGSYRADLVASRNGEQILYEFKSGPWTRDKAEQAKFLRNHIVHECGGKFELVWVSPYRKVDIHIEGLEQLLAEAIRADPDDLDLLSTHTFVEEVEDIQVNALDMGADGVSVTGEGVVYVELNSGSESERDRGDGHSSFDSFPFEFTIRLDKELQPLEAPRIVIDTSSFYE